MVLLGLKKHDNIACGSDNIACGSDNIACGSDIRSSVILTCEFLYEIYDPQNAGGRARAESRVSYRGIFVTTFLDY